MAKVTKKVTHVTVFETKTTPFEPIKSVFPNAQLITNQKKTLQPVLKTVKIAFMALLLFPRHIFPQKNLRTPCAHPLRAAVKGGSFTGKIAAHRHMHESSSIAPELFALFARRRAAHKRR
jgi:hypothetical protein